MKTTHRLRIVARCPANNDLDVYEATVETSELVAVETILKAVENATDLGPVYQEHLTAYLADELNATVTTHGRHSGVETVCVVEGGHP